MNTTSTAPKLVPAAPESPLRFPSIDAYMDAHPECDDRAERAVIAALLAGQDDGLFQCLVDAATAPAYVRAAKSAAAALGTDWRLTMADLLAGALRRGLIRQAD